MTSEFPAQMASNTENVSIWWRHHVDVITYPYLTLSTYLGICLSKISPCAQAGRKIVLAVPIGYQLGNSILEAVYKGWQVLP